MVVFPAVFSRIMMSHLGPVEWGAVTDYQCLPWEVWGLRNLMTHMLWIYRPCYRIKAELLNKAYKALTIWSLTNLPASPLASPCSSHTKLNIVPRTTVSSHLHVYFHTILPACNALPLSLTPTLLLSSVFVHFCLGLRFFLCVSPTLCAYCNQCFNLIIL